MLRHVSIALVFSGAVASAPLHAQTPAAAHDTSALRREIDQRTRDMVAAFNRGDMKGAASFYADDAQILSGGGPLASGRAELDRYFTGIANPRSWQIETMYVTGGGDVAYQVGRSTLVHGSPEVTSVVQFALRWERRDGTWRIVLDYYHMPERAMRQTQAAGTATDEANVRRVIALYFRGHATANADTMRAAFLPTAHIEGNRNGTFTSWTVDRYVQGFTGRPAADEASRKRIVDVVDITGTAAMVKATLVHGATTFTDYFVLLQVDGQWKIANKVYDARR